jgi:TRAP-type C4-dicarboxylate transport system substrate-binding protein
VTSPVRIIAAIATVLAALVLAPRPSSAEPRVTLRVAAVAPEGTPSAVALHEWARQLRDESGGAIKVQLLLGGSLGQDRGHVTRLRSGELDGALLTGTGLALVAREFAALETPMLVESDEELDHLRDVLGPDLRQKVQTSGLSFLAWATSGSRSLYATGPVPSSCDPTGARAWTETSNSPMTAVYQGLRAAPVPLSLTDVLGALQTGTIDTVHASVIDLFAYGWFHALSYDCAWPLGPGIGGLILSQAAVDRLTVAQQELLVRASARFEVNQISRVRAIEPAAARNLERYGVRTLAPDAHLLVWIPVLARRGTAAIVGAAWMERVDQALAAYRASAR